MIPFEILLALSAPGATVGQSVSSGPETGSAAVARTLESLPNTSILYYDVSGTNLGAINEAIAAAAPKDKKTSAVSVSSSEWNIQVRLDQQITEEKCVISGAHARFTASISLPRLINAEALPKDQRKLWNRFVSDLAAQEAAKLWFVHDRVGEVEEAIKRSSCRTAGRLAAAAAERIQRELDSFARVNRKPVPTFEVPVRDPNDPRG